jgi:hypothetical protein
VRELLFDVSEIVELGDPSGVGQGDGMADVAWSGNGLTRIVDVLVAVHIDGSVAHGVVEVIGKPPFHIAIQVIGTRPNRCGACWKSAFDVGCFVTKVARSLSTRTSPDPPLRRTDTGAR